MFVQNRKEKTITIYLNGQYIFLLSVSFFSIEMIPKLNQLMANTYAFFYPTAHITCRMFNYFFTYHEQKWQLLFSFAQPQTFSAICECFKQNDFALTFSLTLNFTSFIKTTKNRFLMASQTSQRITISIVVKLYFLTPSLLYALICNLYHRWTLYWW